MRYGTRIALKRRWTPKKHRPKCRVKIGYEWAFLYYGICPYYGELFCLLLPGMTKECFAIFIRELEAYLNRGIILILDGASNHQPVEDSAIILKRLPPANPELNPLERFFEEMRKKLANHVFENIEQLNDYMVELAHVFRDDPIQIRKLTMYPYIREIYTKS